MGWRPRRAPTQIAKVAKIATSSLITLPLACDACSVAIMAYDDLCITLMSIRGRHWKGSAHDRS